MDKYNYLGELLEDVQIGLSNPEYGEYDGNTLLRDERGYPILKEWITDNTIADDDGFRKDLNIFNDSYKCDILLPKDTKICRYGNQNGFYSALVNTPYEMLGLPWNPRTLQYEEYKVKADGIKVKCVVTCGIVAPAFDSKGGVIQFKHHKWITTECKMNLLEEDRTWLYRLNKNA
jgi:hypothetical protein